MTGLREQELLYIKEKQVCTDGYGCDCEELHLVNCKNGMTIIAIGWTRGNKKALATILPTEYWNKLRALSNFDYNDIVATHKIMKRDVGIGYTIMRKIHYNVMRFREIMGVDEVKYWLVVTNQSVADIMSFMTQRSSLINILQLGKILVLILIRLAHYNQMTKKPCMI